MNYSEYHSHKWSKNLKEAVRRAQSANELAKAGKTEQSKQELGLLYQGDFRNDKQIFPGLKVMAPYWKAEEAMMRCRFEAMAQYSNTPEMFKDKEFTDSVKKYYQDFIDDVRILITRDKILPEPQIIKDYPPKMPDDWANQLQNLMKETESILDSGKIDTALLERWLVFCLNGIIAYNFGLIQQAVLAGLTIRKSGEAGINELVAKSRDDYGWRVSKAFFVEVFPAVNITDVTDLQTIGRYGMFADQDLITKETLPPADRKDKEPKIKTTEFLNCQEYSIFDTVFKKMKVPVKHSGIAMCAYCEEHGKKNTQIFVPPSMKPVVKMLKTLAMGDKSFLFEPKLYPGDDMERFMAAQNKVFGGEF
ncbi:MAG: hypothetical protein HY762_00040 [Planctomycetes bacterium]|nr:hypothetical protein [Planctomycetota bacterium]